LCVCLPVRKPSKRTNTNSRTYCTMDALYSRVDDSGVREFPDIAYAFALLPCLFSVSFVASGSKTALLSTCQLIISSGLPPVSWSWLFGFFLSNKGRFVLSFVRLSINCKSGNDGRNNEWIASNCGCHSGGAPSRKWNDGSAVVLDGKENSAEEKNVRVIKYDHEEFFYFWSSFAYF